MNGKSEGSSSLLASRSSSSSSTRSLLSSGCCGDKASAGVVNKGIKLDTSDIMLAAIIIWQVTLAIRVLLRLRSKVLMIPNLRVARGSPLESLESRGTLHCTFSERQRSLKSIMHRSFGRQSHAAVLPREVTVEVERKTLCT